MNWVGIDVLDTKGIRFKGYSQVNYFWPFSCPLGHPCVIWAVFFPFGLFSSHLGHSRLIWAILVSFGPSLCDLGHSRFTLAYSVPFLKRQKVKMLKRIPPRATFDLWAARPWQEICKRSVVRSNSMASNNNCARKSHEFVPFSSSSSSSSTTSLSSRLRSSRRSNYLDREGRQLLGICIDNGTASSGLWKRDLIADSFNSMGSRNGCF